MGRRWGSGDVQFTEEDERDWRLAEIDRFLDPAYHGRGLGTDVVRTTMRHLREDRGYHRIVIAAMVANSGAIRCYGKAGFRKVGITEAAGRDAWTGKWHDEWLMESVVRP